MRKRLYAALALAVLLVVLLLEPGQELMRLVHELARSPSVVGSEGDTKVDAHTDAKVEEGATTDAGAVDSPTDSAVATIPSQQIEPRATEKKIIPELEGFKVYVYDVPAEYLEAIDELRKMIGFDVLSDGTALSNFAIEMMLHRQLLDCPYRTLDPEEATAFFVPSPAFTNHLWSLRTKQPNRLQTLNAWIKKHPWYKRRGKRDHFTGAMAEFWAGRLFPDVVGLLCVTDMSYNDEGKNYLVLTPHYTANLRLQAITAEQRRAANRTTLAYFNGNIINPLRQRLVDLAKTDKDLVIETTVAGRSSADGYRTNTDDLAAKYLRTEFCLSMPGDHPMTRRTYDAMPAGCIPVIVADKVWLPFEDRIPWPKFSMQLHTKVVQDGSLMNVLRAVTPAQRAEYRKNLETFAPAFRWHWPTPVPGDAFENLMIEVHKRTKDLKSIPV